MVRSAPDRARLPRTLDPTRLLRFLGRNLLLALALAATLAVSTLATMREVLAAREVAVPALVGRSVAEAGAQAAQRRLFVRIEGRRNDPSMPAERVVAQEPPPGASLKTHRAVRVWVSLGPRRVTIPAVEGRSARAARLALEQEGISVARVVEIADRAAEGMVVLQRPPAGEADLAAGGVSLLVSRGPGGAPFVMPDLIGREVGPVLDGLRLAGLKVEDVRYRSYPGVPAGIILRQVPPAGHRVGSSSPLSLDVSKEAP